MSDTVQESAEPATTGTQHKSAPAITRSWRRTSLRARFIAIMLTFALGFGGLTLIANRYLSLNNLIRHEIMTHQEELNFLALSIAGSRLHENLVGLQRHSDRLAESNPTWIGIIFVDSSGTVAVASPAHTQLAEQIAQAAVGKSIVLDHRRALVLSAQLSGDTDMSVRMAMTLEPDYQSAAATTQVFGLMLLTMTVLGVLIAVVMGKYLTAPLEQAAEQVRILARGEYGRQLPTPPYDDEVAVLTQAINELSSNLAEADRILERQQTRMVEVEKLAAVGNLAAIVLHEVVNPLMGVSGCVRRLGGDELSEERRTTYTDLALGALDRASNKLRSLLVYARAGEGRVEPTSLARLAAEATALVATGTGKSVALGSTIDIEVHWNMLQMNQVLVNLLMNATQSSSSKVELRWRRLGTDQVIVEIEDDGSGITRELRERVMEPFFTTRESEGGTGLGLPIVRSLVRAAGGDVELLDGRWHPPLGTLVRLTLPIFHEDVDHAD